MRQFGDENIGPRTGERKTLAVNGSGVGKAGAMKHARKKKKKPIKFIIWIIVVVLISVGACFLIRQFGHKGLQYESNVTIGSVGNGQAQIDELQRMVDESMITMSINASPSMSLSDRESGVNWQIENPAGQSTKLIRVEIYRDDNSEKIYETGALRPGTYVTGTLPDVDLPEGAYSCTAYFYSYDIDTETYLGQAGTQILLTVLP